MRSTVCILVCLKKTFPSRKCILHLDGSGEGPINNLTFVSFCDCALKEMALASASVIGREDLAIDELVELK